jgi:hypothetical protein
MINEQKKPMYFVWERRQGEIKGTTYSAAKYRTMPMTGSGMEADAKRFVLRQPLTKEEENLTLNELIAKYPRPPETV